MGTTRASGRSLDISHDKDIESLKTFQAETELRMNMLFDHSGTDGLLTKLEKVLTGKIDELTAKVEGWASKVESFIQGEPARRQHYDKGWQQANVDTKFLVEKMVKDKEEKTIEMHVANERRMEKNEQALEKLREDMMRGHHELRMDLNKHEKLVQRGIGAILVTQVFGALVVFASVALGLVITVCVLLFRFYTHSLSQMH